MSTYPTKHQPGPPRGGFQLFAVEMGRQVGGAWQVQDYHNAWARLTEPQRAEWNLRGENESAQYKRSFEEWEKDGGETWVKKLKAVTERGALSTKLVGTEMRKVPAACKHEAVKVMATATEAFLGTFAMEAWVHTQNPAGDKKKLGLVDLHKLIHESDARFGFLMNHFEHPSIFGPSGKKKKSKKAIKEAAKLAKAAVMSNTAVTPLKLKQLKPGKEPKAAKEPKQAKTKEPKAAKEPKQPRAIKPVHRPKMEFSTVSKLYEARVPNGQPYDSLSAPEKDQYAEQFRQMKAHFQAAEERWKREYPQEYEAMMKKREFDRERSKKKKDAEGKEAPAHQMMDQSMASMGMMGMQQQQQHQSHLLSQQQAYMQQYQMQPQMGQGGLNFRSVADPSMFGQQQMPPQRRIVEDPNLKMPWKKVHVYNAYTGTVEDEYFWNTMTNATSWEYPWQGR